jgi:hypothetical protein
LRVLESQGALAKPVDADRARGDYKIFKRVHVLSPYS